jgi:hypothetical protein
MLSKVVRHLRRFSAGELRRVGRAGRDGRKREVALILMASNGRCRVCKALARLGRICHRVFDKYLAWNAARSNRVRLGVVSQIDLDIMLHKKINLG